MKFIQLQVAESILDDIGKRIVRIDFRLMKEIGLNIGDIIMLRGERETFAIVDRGYTSDIGLGIIRMDKVTRDKAGVNLQDWIEIRKADTIETEQFKKSEPDAATKKARADALKLGHNQSKKHYQEVWKGVSEESLPQELKKKLKELNIPKGIVGQKEGSMIIAFPPGLKNYREIVKKLQSIGLLQEKAKIRKQKEKEYMEKIWELFDEEEKKIKLFDEDFFD